MIITQYEGRTNKEEREMIDELSLFISEKYFPKHKVQVTYKIMRCLEKNEGIQGDTIWEDNTKDENDVFPISSCARPRCFTIRMQKGYDTKTFLTLIAHEMVHVKQYVLGEMTNRYDAKNTVYRTKWKGKDVTNWAYMRQPFEKEAYRLQEKLLLQFMKSYK